MFAMGSNRSPSGFVVSYGYLVWSFVKRYHGDVVCRYIVLSYGTTVEYRWKVMCFCHCQPMSQVRINEPSQVIISSSTRLLFMQPSKKKIHVKYFFWNSAHSGAPGTRGPLHLVYPVYPIATPLDIDIMSRVDLIQELCNLVILWKLFKLHLLIFMIFTYIQI